MEITNIIIAVVVLVVVVGYFKSLRADLRAKQATTLRDATGITVVTGAKVAKETAKALFGSGKALSNYVEEYHVDAVDDAYKAIEKVKQEHGNVTKAGIHYGNTICEATYLNDANKSLSKYNKKMADKFAK